MKKQVGLLWYRVDEKFVDVIVKRYYEATGDQSIKVVRDGKEIKYSELVEGDWYDQLTLLISSQVSGGFRRGLELAGTDLHWIYYEKGLVAGEELQA